MSFDAETLYSLLPALYRIRDAGQGGPLKALLAVIAEQVAVLEEDLEQLYDDQFIETCAEWAIPYIGDLVGYRALHPVTLRAASARAEVANTIRYRRRKGTAAMLEQLARDVTGYPARAVEFFQLLATTQYLNHLRPERLASVDLRRGADMERLNSALDSLAHTADVRRIATGRGRHNIPNIGIFLWRLRACPLARSPAYKLKPDEPGDLRYLFSPLGTNTPLFTRPQAEELVSELAGPLNLPLPIGRRALDAAISDYYGPGLSLLIEVGDGQIPPNQIVAANLAEKPNGDWAHQPPAGKVAVDPVLGRIAFATPPTGVVRVSFHYGFSAEIGGGVYPRMAHFQTPGPIRQVPSPHGTIQAALAALGSVSGVVEITDSGRYDDLPAQITLATEQRLELRAIEGQRPHLALGGELAITCENGSGLTLDGLLVSGGALRVSGAPGRITLRDCTLVPGLRLNLAGEPVHGEAPSLIIDGTSQSIQVRIERCIVGGIRAVQAAAVTIHDSIVDATDEGGVAYAAPGAPPGLAGTAPAGPLHIEGGTVVGRVHTLALPMATNCIFLAAGAPGGIAPLHAERRQEGCVRFSYLPVGARVPRPYRCQPAGASDAMRVRPQFSSLRYGSPAYAQLSQGCAEEIRRGADDEAEMGTFHHLQQAQREANLRARLEEYLRFSLEAGIIFAS